MIDGATKDDISRWNYHYNEYDNLYWLKGAKENLRDIMDDIEAEYNAEMAADKREDGKVEND